MATQYIWKNGQYVEVGETQVVNQVRIEVVNSLPEEGLPGVMYLLPASSAEHIKSANQYVYQNGEWLEVQGSHTVIGNVSSSSIDLGSKYIEIDSVTLDHASNVTIITKPICKNLETLVRTTNLVRLRLLGPRRGKRQDKHTFKGRANLLADNITKELLSQDAIETLATYRFPAVTAANLQKVDSNLYRIVYKFNIADLTTEKLCKINTTNTITKVATSDSNELDYDLLNLVGDSNHTHFDEQHNHNLLYKHNYGSRIRAYGYRQSPILLPINLTNVTYSVLNRFTTTKNKSYTDFIKLNNQGSSVNNFFTFTHSWGNYYITNSIGSQHGAYENEYTATLTNKGNDYPCLATLYTDKTTNLRLTVNLLDKAAASSCERKENREIIQFGFGVLKTDWQTNSKHMWTKLYKPYNRILVNRYYEYGVVDYGATVSDNAYVGFLIVIKSWLQNIDITE